MQRLLMLTSLFVFALGAFPAHAATQPTLTLTSPTSGGVVAGSTLTVTFATTDWKIVRTQVPLSNAGMQAELNSPNEGHVHFTLDLWPLVVWEEEGAYTFTGLPPGEHQLKAELVNNDHSSLTPPVVQVVRFRTTAGTGASAAAPNIMPRTGAGDANTPTNGALLLLAFFLAGAGLFVQRRARAR